MSELTESPSHIQGSPKEGLKSPLALGTSLSAFVRKAKHLPFITKVPCFYICKVFHPPQLELLKYVHTHSHVQAKFYSDHDTVE